MTLADEPADDNTPDEVLAETAGPADPLDALLRQIINGYFVLTDGQGAVSKWSEPAELLFEQPAEDILGQGFFETLIGGALPPAGQAWRGFLDAGEPPRVPGTVQLTGRRSDGDTSRWRPSSSRSSSTRASTSRSSSRTCPSSCR